jgi:hypothetical protein
MKYISKQNLVLTLLLVVTCMGCKKQLDINENPNQVTDNNVTPELIFTQAEVATGDRTVGGNAASQGSKLPLQFAYNWIGYMASNGTFAREYTETSYNIDFTFGDVLWQNYYNTLFDLHLVQVKGLANNDTALAGAAMILSAKLFQEVTDTYGNVPYSQAFNIDNYLHPAYDEAKDIYAALQLSLDTAIAYLHTTITNSFIDADVMANGDASKWIKFANTVKLRLLIRQSEVSGFNPAADIAKIMNNGGVLDAGESFYVNPGYVNEINKQSPFYANYGYTVTGVVATSSWNANAYIIGILKNSNDPRIGRLFTPVGSDYVGNRYGDDPGNLPTGSNTSYFGPAIAGSAQQNQWIMASFESLFLKAEAIARRWMPGDAQQAYEAAVKESFAWLGVPDAETAADSYMSSYANANWANAGSTPEEQSRFVVFQKYIAMCCIDPLEAWADERRLHFLPEGYISDNPSRISNTLPVRLLYPQSEYTTNGASVTAEGDIDQFTSKIFWQP